MISRDLAKILAFQSIPLSEVTEKWSRIYFSDVFEEKQRGLQIRRVKCDMSANDLCFCGSGVKQKKCHAEVNENSAMANLLRVYHKIDSEVKEKADGVCKKGCRECCRDFFNISCLEYFTILRHLKITFTENDIENFISLAKTNAAGIVFPDSNLLNLSKNAPCIFVDDTSGECKMYEVRPIICRLYGDYSGITQCKKVLTDSRATADLLSSKGKLEFEQNIDTFFKNGEWILTQGRPIVHWFGKDRNSLRFKDLALAAQNGSIGDFAKIIFM